MILAIDTSARHCAVALETGAAQIVKTEAMTRGHADRLFPMIDELLDDAGAGFSDISRVAVVTGPGSFTGVRVGLSAARGLALGVGCPVLGLTRFEMLAEVARGAGEVRPLCIALALRAGAVAYQAFGADGAPEAEPALLEADALRKIAPHDRLRIGDGWADDGPEPTSGDQIAAALRLAARMPDPVVGDLPAPLYLRGADADPPRDPPPVMLD